MRKRTQRLWMIVAVGLCMAGGVAFVIRGLSQNMTYFYTPLQLSQLAEKPTRPFRIGGMVEAGSYHGLGEGLITFVVTDFQGPPVKVEYKGLVPDLFREGQGVIAEGVWGETGIFQAREILAKHDEKYMPPELKGIPTAPSAPEALPPK